MFASVRSVVLLVSRAEAHFSYSRSRFARPQDRTFPRGIRSNLSVRVSDVFVRRMRDDLLVVDS